MRMLWTIILILICLLAYKLDSKALQAGTMNQETFNNILHQQVLSLENKVDKLSEKFNDFVTERIRRLSEVELEQADTNNRTYNLENHDVEQDNKIKAVEQQRVQQINPLWSIVVPVLSGVIGSAIGWFFRHLALKPDKE